MAQRDWARWIFASLADHLKQVAVDRDLPVLVEHLDERTEAFMRATDRAEIRITGPFTQELSKGYWRVFVDANVLLTSRFDGDRKDAYSVLKHAGAFHEAMDLPIGVWNFGGEPGDYVEDQPETQKFLGLSGATTWAECAGAELRSDRPRGEDQADRNRGTVHDRVIGRLTPLPSGEMHMARIDLRNCTIYLKDGLTGTAKANKTLTPDKAAVAQGDTTCKVSDVSIPGARDGLTEKVPIGARFTIAGETAETVHTVTQRTLSGSQTTDITFSPALGAGTYATDAAVTFQPQQIEIKIGDGDLKYTEADQYKYDLDRGLLDTVRKGDDQPMEISMNFTFDQVKSGTSEVITPIEALKGIEAASEWVSSSSDACEPYAVDVVVDDVRPCGSDQSRTYTFPDFRSEKRDYDLKNANIAVSGKCNATEPIITIDE